MNNTVEKEIKEKGYYGGLTHGSSMYPLLYNLRDIVHIIPINGKLKKYDVVLFRRKNGQLVLHRLLRSVNSGYIMCGDGQFKKEYRVQQSQIIGVMDSFYRNKKYICVTNLWYKFYVYIWCFSLPTKWILMKAYNLVIKIKKYFKTHKFSNRS
ncbi:MAG TPA: hypothetical protein GX401_02890 [Clostridiales bacterium]|nr:hypothetical protein [Clostridiales bacterium]